MSRANRLLRLVQLLRRHRRPVSAASLAGELGVSVRSVYRDIDALREQGASIEGEREPQPGSGGEGLNLGRAEGPNLGRAARNLGRVAKASTRTERLGSARRNRAPRGVDEPQPGSGGARPGWAC
ncbi:HTH domain-containing protein [Sorangium sp. So ce1151]